jgi:Tol biopolymer transport system component
MFRRLVVGAMLLLLAGTAAAVALPQVADELPGPLQGVARLPERLWTRAVAPRVPAKARGAGLTASERAAVEALGPRLDGLVVWSSNRGGNHELYLLDLRDRRLRTLTHDRHVDFFSRLSPDGRHVLFLRSEREWVSFRDLAAWDVYLVNVDGTGERRLARPGYHPTWTADGRAVIFEREAQVIRYDLGTARESVLFDGRGEFSGLTEIGDFALSPDGTRLAFVLRGTFAGAHALSGAFSGAVVFDLRTRKVAVLTREQACQTTWAPDGERVIWVETGGNRGTRVMAGRPDGSARGVLMDLPGPLSHEYFPTASPDGHWLIWGAAAEGHEHDRADYEVFVWRIGTPWSEAVRLTHHPGNDQWPDLWVRPRG